MTHLTRCHCDECTRLDRLPARRQGIPGAVQMTFAGEAGGSGPRLDDAPRFEAEMAELAAQMVAKYGNPYGPYGRTATTPDALPLFAGSLEPTLF